MAAYPSTGYSRESRIDPLGGQQLDRADDGTPRVRSFYPVTQYNLTIIHPQISATEKDAIMAFYDANKNNANTFTDLITTTVYDVIIPAAPVPVHVYGSFWNVVTFMTGKKA